jgi:AcrR family transcriptional regulator
MVATELDGRKIRAAERREETRERLLAAAVAVFAEQGFQAGTTKAITQRAGVAEGLLFHYFPTKSDLVLALLARYPLEPEIARLLAEAGDAPVAATLPRMAQHWLAVLRGNRTVTLVLLQAAYADPQVQAAIGGAVAGVVRRLAAYFAAHETTGELRPGTADTAAQLLFESLCTLGMPCAAAPVGDPERLLAARVDLLLHGMLTDQAHSLAVPGEPRGSRRAQRS